MSAFNRLKKIFCVRGTLIVSTVLGSCALYLFIINSVINCESFQVITLEVNTLDFVSKNIAKSAN